LTIAGQQMSVVADALQGGETPPLRWTATRLFRPGRPASTAARWR
jgi:hypothetical protein